MEAATNIAVGLAVSQAANLVVLPLVLGVHVSQGAAFSLGVIYTAISLVRQYVLRRAFNGRSVWQAVKGCWAKRRRVVQFHFYSLDCNWHGKRQQTLRRTVRLVRMGAYVKMWTLYVYRADGRAHAFQLAFPWWRGEWPASCSEREPRI